VQLDLVEEEPHISLFELRGALFQALSHGLGEDRDFIGCQGWNSGREFVLERGDFAVQFVPARAKLGQVLRAPRGFAPRPGLLPVWLTCG